MHIRKSLLVLPVLYCCMLFSFTPSEALVIKGCFPLREGCFWNFAEDRDGQLTTWAVNGSLSLRGAGRVLMMHQEDGPLLCLREDWEGLRVYAEFYTDRFLLPEQPLLFLPRDLDVNPASPPVEAVVTLRVFTDPGGMKNYQETGKELRKISFRILGIEDITVGGVAFRDAIVVEKKTVCNRSTLTEKLWLAHGIGPVKRVVQRGSVQTTWLLHTNGRDESGREKTYAAKDLLPLNEGTKLIYQDQNGNPASVTIRGREKARLHDGEVIPYVDSVDDIQYFAYDARGLVMPQKFWAAYGGLTAYSPPEKPALVLPARLTIGDFNFSISHPRSYNPRSLTLFEQNHPELQYSSIAVGTEDITVPAGTFTGCVKVSLFYNISNFELQFDVIRSGYVWLAPGTGIVKEQVLNMYNYSLPESVNSILDVRSWKLQAIETVAMAAPAPVSAAAPDTRPAKKFDELRWEGNSRAMFDKVVAASPFFIRLISERKMMKAVANMSGADGLVTEDIVIECTRQETPPKYLEQILKDLEPLRTRGTL